MEKKTAEEILRDNAAVPKPQIPGVLNAMEEYSSLQSEEKDNRITELEFMSSSVKGLLRASENEIERLREALNKMCVWHEKQATYDKGDNGYYAAKRLLSNQPIESDKDRRIKELEELLENIQKQIKLLTHN